MTRPKHPAGARRLAVIALALTALVATATPSAAHTPVRLNSGDVLPWRGPLLLDGQSPTLLFGTLPMGLTFRSAQFQMQAGEHVLASLAVPDEAPENLLSPAHLPMVFIVAPDGSVAVLKAETRIPIHTESGLNLLIISSYSAAAVSGRYSIIITGLEPARFALSTGLEGLPFAGIERGNVATGHQVAAWYATPPARHCRHSPRSTVRAS